MHSALLMVLVGVSAVISANIPPNGLKKTVPLEMELIGQIGSKAYYTPVDLAETVNWMAARQICEEAEFQLGSTENNAEFRYLYDTKKGNDYWTAGSLKGFAQDIFTTSKGFEWVDGTELPEGPEINFVQDAATWLCTYFSGDDHTYVDSCINGKHQVLCQKKE